MLVAGSDDDLEDVIADWNDIDGTVRHFGSPELADHLSGHIFMQGTPVEDKSAKCVRLGDLLHRFSDRQFVHCVQCVLRWQPDYIADSGILQELLIKMDGEAAHRRSQLQCHDNLKVVFAFARLFTPATKSPSMTIEAWKVSIAEEAIQRVILFLLLLALNSAKVWK